MPKSTHYSQFKRRWIPNILMTGRNDIIFRYLQGSPVFSWIPRISNKTHLPIKRNIRDNAFQWVDCHFLTYVRSMVASTPNTTNCMCRPTTCFSMFMSLSISLYVYMYTSWPHQCPNIFVLDMLW